MARDITLAEVDQAEAANLAAKKKGSRAGRRKAAEELVAIRSAYRRQEEAAGRRTGLVVAEGN
jgi:hypothetical protein